MIGLGRRKVPLVFLWQQKAQTNPKQSKLFANKIAKHSPNIVFVRKYIDTNGWGPYGGLPKMVAGKGGRAPVFVGGVRQGVCASGSLATWRPLPF